MRLVTIFLLLAGAAIIAWLVLARPEKREQGSTQQGLAVSKPTDSLTASLAVALTDYDKLSEQFVNWDSVATPATAQTLTKDLDNLNLSALKKDSAAVYETVTGLVESAKAELQTIGSEKAIKPQREAFSNLSDNLVHLLNTVQYNREKLYLQECTMAYEEGGIGHWLSKSGEADARRNPYLGLHDPHYGKGMLRCGETKQTINHTGKE